MSRREFTRKIKAAAIARAAGRCEKCQAKLKPREGEVDHILEDALGGEPVLANAQVLCAPCHKEKTADRIAKIRKADRARDKASGAMRAKVKIPSRPPAPKPEKTAKHMPARRLLYTARTNP